MNWETVTGLAAAALTTSAYLPQAVKTVRMRSTGDISLAMYVVLNFGTLLWLVYGILILNLAIILANSITIVFTGTILYLKVRYR